MGQFGSQRIWMAKGLQAEKALQKWRFACQTAALGAGPCRPEFPATLTEGMVEKLVQKLKCPSLTSNFLWCQNNATHAS